MQEHDLTILSTGSLSSMRELQRELAARGISAELTAADGCSGKSA